jgi:hypothetical protein
MLSGSESLKAVHRMLMKLSPDILIHLYFLLQSSVVIIRSIFLTPRGKRRKPKTYYRYFNITKITKSFLLMA